jgi:hypothetical protein
VRIPLSTRGQWLPPQEARGGRDEDGIDCNSHLIPDDASFVELPLPLCLLSFLDPSSRCLLSALGSETSFCSFFQDMGVVSGLAGVPVMYALMSANEYVTHRYYQHNEVGKLELYQTLRKMDKIPKLGGFFLSSSSRNPANTSSGCLEPPHPLLWAFPLTQAVFYVLSDGGGHIEHHAETYDDMTLKTDNPVDLPSSLPCPCREASSPRPDFSPNRTNRLLSTRCGWHLHPPSA